jgi:hypothetical protein
MLDSAIQHTLHLYVADGGCWAAVVLVVVFHDSAVRPTQNGAQGWCLFKTPVLSSCFVWGALLLCVQLSSGESSREWLFMRGMRGAGCYALLLVLLVLLGAADVIPSSSPHPHQEQDGSIVTRPMGVPAA